MKQNNTCGFETMVMSVECLAFDIRNPQVHIPTASSEAVGLSTYKSLERTFHSGLFYSGVRIFAPEKPAVTRRSTRR